MTLDAETIVRAALELLRQEGLAGLTFRKLTTKLGVKAPAIYWRFANKQDLLEAVAEAILQEQFADLTPFPGAQPWRPWLTALLGRLRTALLAYPDGARVVAGARPLSTPTLPRIAEYALRALEEEGVGLSDASNVVFTAIHFTFGRVIEEQDSTGADEMDEPTTARFAQDYPTIARALANGHRTGLTRDHMYEAGLSLIIGGS